MKNRSVRDWETPMGQKILRDSPSHTNVEVTEHRAPTDESIKIMREMEVKARDNVLLAIRCEGNAFKYKAIVYSDNFHFSQRLRIWFRLNENEHEIDVEIDRMDTHRLSRQELTIKIRDEVAKKIASHLCIAVLSDHVIAGQIL